MNKGLTHTVRVTLIYRLPVGIWVLVGLEVCCNSSGQESPPTLPTMGKTPLNMWCCRAGTCQKATAYGMQPQGRNAKEKTLLVTCIWHASPQKSWCSICTAAHSRSFAEFSDSSTELCTEHKCLIM
jgi:hypothetical protein